MVERKIKAQARGQKTVDGAGVHLVRVLGHDTARDFDPFLMLDSFDSKNPADYIAGFPFHPHRGIETITYVLKGAMEHQDSLGNSGTIRDGEVQWMTAGSGIMHQEMPQASAHMLGAQLWLNLPAADKMAIPQYFSITNQLIGEKQTPSAAIRVIAGEYQDVKGAAPHYIPVTYYDVALREGAAITLDTKPAENVFVFLIVGDAIINEERIAEKTAVLFGEGDTITIAAPPGQTARFLFLSGKPLREEISWGGPIVMNTKEELNRAFQELEEGTFIKHQPVK
jgi:redox-sensitive bicupin YhaK (pirin superfamily)